MQAPPGSRVFRGVTDFLGVPDYSSRITLGRRPDGWGQSKILVITADGWIWGDFTLTPGLVGVPKSFAVSIFFSRKCEFSHKTGQGIYIHLMGNKITRPPEGTGRSCPGGEIGKHRGLPFPRICSTAYKPYGFESRPGQPKAPSIIIVHGL